MGKKKGLKQLLPKDPIGDWVNQAVQQHRAGALAEAEKLYQRVLQQQPTQVEALHGLGILALQQGQPETAIAPLQQAVALQPNHAFAHVHLAHALRGTQQVEAALPHYQRALSLNPQLAEVYLDLGNVFLELGQTQQAIAAYGQAIAVNARLPKAHYSLGMAHQVQGNFDAAVQHYQQAIALQPDYLEAHNNLGNLLLKQQRAARAIRHFKQAIALVEQAGLPPIQAAGPHANLARALEQTGDIERAVQHYRKALQLQPHFPEVHNNLGDLYRDQNQMPEAIAHYERAIALQPDLPEAHSNLGMALLRIGDFRRGWAEFEWRSRCAELSDSPFPQPAWDGFPLDGKTILLYGQQAEQAYGDAIQFIRYAPLIQALGGQVIVQCQQPLVRLFALAPGVDRVVTPGESLSALNVQASLMSLPFLLKTTLETIPAAPYLQPPVDGRITLPAAPDGNLKVGLVWAGRPLYQQDPRRDRTCPLRHFAPLLELPGFSFYSLQKGVAIAELEQLGWQEKIHDLNTQLNDFADTAAAIAQLDLVITVDTAVAHLAGALGQSVWVLLPFAAEWRWLMDRDDSPWYSTMKLFRQPTPGDWVGAIAQML
jgi:tetratricopeptide (TPR) repeat protein